MPRPVFLTACICSMLLLASVQRVVADDAAAAEDAEDTAPASSVRILSIAAITAEVATIDGKKSTKLNAKYPDKLFKNTDLDTRKSIEITFTPDINGAAGTPQQAMLLLQPSTGPAAYAVAKVKKDGSHVITLTPGLITKQVGKQGGSFAVSLLLGDPSCSKGLSWALGQVQLPEDPQAVAEPKYLTANFQPASNAQPEIVHIFRPAEKTPPAVISLAFAGLALVPLGGLVIGLLALGVNFKGMPSGSGSLWALLFHGSIAAMLLLYMLFWVKLNLAQTMPLALALGAAVSATGYLSLSSLSAERLRAQAALEVKKTS